MCGISGIYQPKSQSVEKQRLERMQETLRHRGPDDHGSYIERNIGLGHQRLSIIDLKSGQQPMLDSSRRYTITFNGEIYNYLELRQNLENRGARFHSQSDTEVILEAYKAYGIDCLKHFNGMFAFVIYDRQQETFFGARDRFGIKPFYYCHSKDTFSFASEIKALLAYQQSSPEPSHEAMLDYLTFQYIFGEKTLFRGIYRLLPGHYFTYGWVKVTDKTVLELECKAIQRISDPAEP